MSNRDIEERRKHQRSDAQSLLYYICLDEDCENVQQGMGKTLNVSLDGILLETHVAIEPNYMVALSIGLADQTVDIGGSVVHTAKGENGMFQTGIEFRKLDAEARETLETFIAAFEKNRNH
ncbi:MAG: PilZ domain-containing protein [Desulfobacterales bacterium]